MTMPNIPNFGSLEAPSRKETVLLLLTSVARGEMALSHIINAEAEKLHHAAAALRRRRRPSPTVDELLCAQESALSVVKEVLATELLLQTKLDRAKELLRGPCRRESSDMSVALHEGMHAGGGYEGD